MALEFMTLCVSGEDAAAFLQGQLTADIYQLDFIEPKAFAGNMGLAGLCNNKGRLIAVFWAIEKQPQTFHLLLPKDEADRVRTLLARYIFRSKVQLTLSEPESEDLVTLPQTLIIPWIIPAHYEKYVPQMVSLDVLKGVHPKKGCYIGQEIVTRMRDLGKNKKRLALVKGNFSADLEISTNLMNDSGVSVGELLAVTEDMALVVINLNAVAQPLFLEGSVVIQKVWKHGDE